MTKEVIVRLRDDLSKQLGEDVATREFTIDGVAYETELSDANYQKFLKANQKYIDAARVVKAPPKKKPAKKTEASAIRAWAKEQGMAVAPRGGIAPDVVRAYNAAHSKAGGA